MKITNKKINLSVEQQINDAYGGNERERSALYVMDWDTVRKYKRTFNYWYTPLLDHRKISRFLTRFCTKHFDKWWPYCDAEIAATELFLYCCKKPDRFEMIWDQVYDIIDWEKDRIKRDWCGRHLQQFHCKPIIALMMGCNKYMDMWWDPDKVNWKLHSKYLAWHCRKQFDIWWDPKRFNYDAVRWLAKYCPDKFDIWWSPKISYRRGSGMLCKHLPHKFDVWWNPDRFNWGIKTQDSRAFLIQYCSRHFEKWWDPKRFTFRWGEYELFEKHCGKYKEHWLPDALVIRLENEGGEI